MRQPGNAYIWEYQVRPKCVHEFEAAYGPNGTWCRLFREADGYVRTELHRDRRDPLRYLTIDYWESAPAWEAFRRDFADQFERLDASCEELTESEREIGRLDPVGDNDS